MMQTPSSRIPPIWAAAVASDLYKPCACLHEQYASDASGCQFSRWGRTAGQSGYAILFDLQGLDVVRIIEGRERAIQPGSLTGMAQEATPENETRHARFPHHNLPSTPSPQSSPASGRGGEREKQLLIPAGEGANESLREFCVNADITALESELDHAVALLYGTTP